MKEYLTKLIEKKETFLEWTYTTKNGYEYTCNIRRSSGIGSLCGYVRLTPDSKLYGVSYDIYDIVNVIVRWINIFSRGDKDDWIIGFDCAHLGDLNPTF
jgi:hypothetical protein